MKRAFAVLCLLLLVLPSISFSAEREEEAVSVIYTTDGKVKEFVLSDAYEWVEYTLVLPHGAYSGAYTGEMKNGVPNGFGSFFYKADDIESSFAYSGHFIDGVPNGEGAMLFGDYYGEQGTFTDGMLTSGKYNPIPALKTYVVMDSISYDDENEFAMTGHGKAYNTKGQMVFEGKIDGSILQEGTFYDPETGIPVATGIFGRAFSNYIWNNQICGFYYYEPGFYEKMSE